MRVDPNYSDLRLQADEGNVDAMEQLGLYYLKSSPTNCVTNESKRLKMAFSWFDKARLEGSICGTAHVGWMLVMGQDSPAREFLSIQAYSGKIILLNLRTSSDLA